MTDVTRLGGGYAESRPDPLPTVEAVLRAARPGSPAARLAVLCGPPGVGKSAAAARLSALVPNSMLIEKDATAAGFILAAAGSEGVSTSQAYGTARYWSTLRPLEYAGPTALACANLEGTRLVLLVGGWGPELAVPRLWTGLLSQIAPSLLSVIHLDPPPLDAWRSRMVARGSRGDSPWFEDFAAAVTSHPVWEGAFRIGTDRPLEAVVQHILLALDR